MIIKQFEDKNLAHYSYALVSNGEMALVDPSRNPQPYYDFANEMNAKIVAIFETHPHADFVSSHLEIHQQTGAAIYVSRLLGAEYQHKTFDDGDVVKVGDSVLSAYNTPGHSPDSITILAKYERGKDYAVFTGDTLFIGDCGRPDLRENAGAIQAKREELAKQMFHSLRNVFLNLSDEVLVYPAHGAGSLCGKGLSSANESTIGLEKKSNWSLQQMSEAEFVTKLLADQPFIPKYFTFNVALNKKGATSYQSSISNVEIRGDVECKSCYNSLNKEILIVDTRPQKKFKQSHIKGAINVMNDLRFETWLGSIVNPGEKFYLIAENKTELLTLIERISKIGYESQIEEAFVSTYGNESSEEFSVDNLNEDLYTIVDIRNEGEVKTKRTFANSIHIPLYELRERISDIPVNKPIVVHCAGGYRSAAGCSILRSAIGEKVKVYDLSEAVKLFA